MSEKKVPLNEEVIKGQLKELVRGSVEETLNELLEQEAEKLTQAARYERNEARQGYRSGHYDRNLTITLDDVTLAVFPNVKYQRCIIHFYRDVFSVVPKSKMKTVAQMLKAIHAQENKKAAREKARMVMEELKAMKLKEAAKKIGVSAVLMAGIASQRTALQPIHFPDSSVFLHQSSMQPFSRYARQMFSKKSSSCGMECTLRQ